MGKGRRQHLHQKLNDKECKNETERRGNPKTLVVTKRDHVKEAHDAWLRRCNEAREELLKFEDQEGLRRLLGPDPFVLDELLELRAVVTDRQRGPAFFERRPLVSVKGNRLPLIRPGVKRKASKVDLNAAGSRSRIKIDIVDLWSESE